ncbi:MAG: phosphomethylpyrimidine synthase ThiC [Syntrophobacterales bacterium]|jgi:phosphomethylpyrimidine synthase|nr:phosphomethylpyrimidine synthase ThiC [Syntrophobacterales bacterium]
MTQLEKAQKGKVTEEMRLCALDENVSPKFIQEGVKNGTIVVVRNQAHDNGYPSAVGRGLRTKINANIGTSLDRSDIEFELEKIKVCIEAKADAVMDLSTGGDLRRIRQAVIAASPMIVGTVPIYQAAADAIAGGRSLMDLTADDMFRAIEEHGKDGVDFITVHCGVTRQSVGRILNEGRILGIVSRGGSILARWMEANDQENPLYEDYDRLLEIARKYDMVLSLGDGLRPGCIADATDRGQIQELILLGELTQKARDRGVQVMIEGPGHVPLEQIKANILLQKKICHGAPFYVLGPLPTDIAPGYDHITSAIGGALAGAAGADFLCYVTPSEHLRLPNLDDVREGIMTSRLAAHIADLAKGLPGAMDLDLQMARMRKEFDWEGQINLSIDPDRTRAWLEKSESAKEEGCTMCGELCAIKLGKEKTHRMF